MVKHIGFAALGYCMGQPRAAQHAESTMVDSYSPLQFLSCQSPAPIPDCAQGVELIADPIHGYVPFTVPLERTGRPEEVTEKDLIDTPWMQRLRAIMQLQSARWVFPAAEHDRLRQQGHGSSGHYC